MCITVHTILLICVFKVRSVGRQPDRRHAWRTGRTVEKNCTDSLRYSGKGWMEIENPAKKPTQCGLIVWWLGRWDQFAISRLQVWLLAMLCRVTTLSKLFTHLPLTPSNIISQQFTKRMGVSPLPAQDHWNGDEHCTMHHRGVRIQCQLEFI